MSISITRNKRPEDQPLISLPLRQKILKILGDSPSPRENRSITEQTTIALLRIDDDAWERFYTHLKDTYGICFNSEARASGALSTIGSLIDLIEAEVLEMKRTLFLPMKENPGKLLEQAQHITFASQADIYVAGDKAIKLFHPWQSETKAYKEARKQMMAYHLGVPVPAVYDITDGDRTAIVMDYISGFTMGEKIMADESLTHEYIHRFVDVQSRIHAIKNVDFPLQQKLLKARIKETSLKDKSHLELFLALADQIDNQTTLCHGDLHFYNMIDAENTIYVIDWQDGSLGNALVDACRSYLLYVLYKPRMAESYLQQYCQKLCVPPDEVLRWLPLNAAVRLCDNIDRDDKTELMAMINHGGERKC